LLSSVNIQDDIDNIIEFNENALFDLEISPSEEQPNPVA
jgi:hypothetical protein